MRRHNSSTLACVIAFCLNTGLQGAPSEPNDPPKRTHVPTVFFDHGATFPPLYRPATDAEPNSPSRSEEVLFGTHSFRERGTVYDLEFYYRKLYECMRVRVLVSGQELRGLFNRVYHIDPGREIMFWVSRWEGESIELTFNGPMVKLKAYPIDTDAIYDAAEALVSRSRQPDPNPYIDLYQPPGLLKKTCWVRISAISLGHNYLINEQGQVDPFNLETLRIAYNREQVRAQSPPDYARIGRSLITAENELTSQCRIAVISSVADIPGYQSHPLDAQSEVQVKPAAVHTDANTQRDYWTCFTYRAHRGVVARYTFGFHNGDLCVTEKTVIAEGIGNAYYIKDENLYSPNHSAVTPAANIGSQARKPPRTWPLGMLSGGLIMAGTLLLLAACVVKRRIKLKSGACSCILLFLLLLSSGCERKRNGTTSQPGATDKGDASRQAQAEHAAAQAQLDTVRLSLHQAARDGDLSKALALITNGCEANTRNRYGYTALHYAALDGHKEVAELLVAHGADVAAETWVGDTPLHCAVERGRRDVVEFLIAKGANINAQGNSGRTPLQHAARLGNKDLVHLLLAKGADVNAADRSRWLPLHGAAQQNAVDIAEILIARGTDVNCRDHGGFTPLHIAAWAGHKEMVEFLLARGANVNAPNWRGTPLHLAVDGGHKDLVQLLLAKGADVSTKNESRESAIDLARRQKQTEILEILTATK